MAWLRTWPVFLALGLQCLLSFGAEAYEFRVGGSRGWTVPMGNKTETFNAWAERNRFQIGDTLVFKYKQGQDSVLRVSAEDYQACNTAKPIESFSDGNTVFKFPRSGPFYFISGAAGNCQNGEKLLIVVLSPRNNSRSGGRTLPAPASAPTVASPPGAAPPASAPTVATPPGAAPSPSIAAPAPVVASPPSKAPSPSTASPASGPSPSSASAPFIASTPTPSLVPSPGPSTASPVSAPSVVSPTPESVPSSAPAPSAASLSPASLKAPAPALSSAPSIPPATGTPPQSASSPVVAVPSAPPSAESVTPSAATSIGFASVLPLVMIIVSSLLN